MMTLTTKQWKAYWLIAVSFVMAILFIRFNVQATSWSVLPPALAIALAFLTGSLRLSLGSAVLLGAFLQVYGLKQNLILSFFLGIKKTLFYFLSAFVGSEATAIATGGSGSFLEAISWTNLEILGFVFCILSMVHVMTASGGLHALVHSLQRWIVGPRSAQLVTAILGCLIFIDDYANTMIVGSAMRKVTDRYKVSREKLAFLVDATSAPIAGVALVSTWIGYEVGLFTEMSEKFSWGIDGYAVFLDAIQFRFYCFLMLAFVFLNVVTGIDFGPMRDYQKSPVWLEAENEVEPRGHWLCAVFPLVLLLSLVFTLLWRDGGGFAPDRSFFSLKDWRHVLTASQNGILILLISSAVSYLFSFLVAIPFSQESLKTLFKTIAEGFKSAILPIFILVLAWSLKEVCDDLKTGEYIVSLLGDKVSHNWLPMAIFVVAAVTAFSTGTSWGTMAILIPTVTPLAVTVAGGEYGLFVSLCLAAILDGAIMGDHCSPISDTTIMSSISSGCELMNHVRSQLPYSLVVGSLAILFGYLPAGFQWPLATSFILSIVAMTFLFFALKLWPKLRKGAYE